MAVADPDDVENQPDKITLWQCSGCSLFNKAVLNKCKKCSVEKPKEPKIKRTYV